MIARMFSNLLSRLVRKRRGSEYVIPLDPREERELDLLRQRREMRERAEADQDDGGTAQ